METENTTNADTIENKIKKDPGLIKECQVEIARMDVLVCGGCHSVFHYVEEFQDHRLMGHCTENSSIREGNMNESKSQVWAFLLWKNSQAKAKSAAKAGEKDSAWTMYQKWCKLDPNDRETWVAAGRSVQAFTKFSTSKIALSVKKGTDDALEEGEIRLPKAQQQSVQGAKLTTIRKVVKSDINSSQDDKSALDLEDDSEDEDDESESDLDTEEEAELEEMQREVKRQNELKKSMESKKVEKTTAVITEIKKNNENPVQKIDLTDPKNRIAKRSTKIASDDSKNGDDDCQYVVEKIIAKRFNFKRTPKPIHEYLIKWDGYSTEHNTWEPIDHFDTCKSLLEEFERNLARQKEKKAAMGAAQQAAAQQAASQPQVQQRIITVPKTVAVVPHTLPSQTSGRPTRTSKIKAMGQVKAWCGSMVDDDGGKRRMSDSDSEDEVSDRKIRRTTEGSSSGDDTKHVKTVQGIAVKQNSNRIVSKTTVPQVRVIQKGESLSSGIIRMSQGQKIQPALKSGIAAKPVITGHRPVLTPQKRTIGQPTLKVVHKRVIAAPGKQTPIKPATQIEIKQKTKDSKLVPGNSVHMEFQMQSDSSEDELPDPFPKDLPPPSPESPPRPLTLCPLTGKVLSKAEGERTPEPSPPAVPEETNESKEVHSIDPETQSEQATTLSSLVVSGNGDIVKAVENATDQAAGNIGEIILPEGGELGSDVPLMITGEDGTVYQVAGHDENGQTLLVAQGADGEQQCVYLAAPSSDGEGILTLSDAVTQLVPEEQTGVEEPLMVDTDMNEGVDDSQVVARVVKAEMPSPGGTRKVVLLLPNGTLAVTTVSADQYSALDLE